MAEDPNLIRLNELKKKFSGCYCGNLRKAARRITHVYDQAMLHEGVRSTQMPILLATQTLGVTTSGQLAELLMLDKTTLTRNIKPLEKQGLVKIEPGKDRREKHIRLTHEGEELTTRAVQRWEELQREMEERFGTKRLSRMLEDLTQIVEGSQDI